jgi:FkbM family methyltransferase
MPVCIQHDDPHIGNKVEICVSLIYHHLLHPGACAIDGGANGGAHTIPMGRLVAPGGKIFAFEPQPDALENLSRWVALEKLQDVVMARECAIGATHGRTKFFISPDNNALSSLDALFAKEGSREIEVAIERLDDLVPNAVVCVIKLDLEGGEYRALLGASSILRSSRPVVVFEFARSWSAERFGFSREEFFLFFKELDYELYDIYGNSIPTDDWEAAHIGWEWIAMHKNDPRKGLILFLTTAFWSGASESRPPLEDWERTLEYLRDPFGYIQPFSKLHGLTSAAHPGFRGDGATIASSSAVSSAFRRFLALCANWKNAR